MQVFGLFHGGANYAVGSVHDTADIDTYPSLRAAVDTVWFRVSGRDREYPMVDDTAVMHVWLTDPRAEAEGNDGRAQEYPDRVVRVGPRGGIRVERV